MKPIYALLALAVLCMAMPSAYAEKGKDYDAVITGNTVDGRPIITHTLGIPERIHTMGEWRDWKLSEDANNIILETMNSGSIVFDKNTCSYNLYNIGITGGANQPVIKGISYTVKGKASASSTWTNVNSVNNAACVGMVDEGANEVVITGTKTSSAGTFQIELRHVPGHGIKETLKAYNNNPAWTNHNIGFTQKFEVPQVVQFGNNMYDLSNYNQTVFDRDWITNNKAKLLKLSQNIYYDFGPGFANLNDIKVEWIGGKAYLLLNFLYPTGIVPYQEWIEIDPTFGYVTGSFYGVQVTSGAGSCSNAITVFTATTNGQVEVGSTTSCYRTSSEWDITTLPTNILISNMTLRIDNTAGAAARSCDVTSMEFQPSTQAVSSRWGDIGNGTTYLTNNGFCIGTGTDKTFALGSSAISNLQSKLGMQTWWAAGFKNTLETRDGANHDNLLAVPELQITYTLFPSTIALKPMQYDNSTSFGSGYVTQKNATVTTTKVINGSGYAVFPSTSSLAQYNYTVKDALDNFVDNKTYNKAIGADTAKQGPVNIFPISLDANPDMDEQVKVNFTNYHNLTYWTTPYADADGDILALLRFTKDGIGPATNQTTKILMRVLDTANFGYSPSRVLWNGTSIPFTFTNNVMNATGAQVANGYSSVRYNLQIITDNVTSAPTALSATPTSGTNINLSWTAPSELHGASITGYRIWRDTAILVSDTGSTSTTYSDGAAGPAGTSHTYMVCAINRIGCSPYSGQASATTHTTTLGTITIVVGNVGDTINANATVTITAGSPTPFTVSSVRLYDNNTLVSTNSTSFSISAVGNHYVSRIWYQIPNDSLNIFHVRATVSNSTGTVTFSSNNANVTREYDPDYLPADDNPAVEGFVNYTLSRFDDEDGIHLQVNRDGGTLGTIWDINCIVQTNSEARSTVNQSESWPGTWRNYSNTGYFNDTWTGLVNTHGYVTCFNPPGQLFTTVSYTNSSLVLFGIAVFDESYGAMLGVPVGIFFLALAGGMASKRTAPTWIVVLLGMAGIMATIGFFTFTPIVWGLALVTGLLGLLVNQKVF